MSRLILPRTCFNTHLAYTFKFSMLITKFLFFLQPLAKPFILHQNPSFYHQNSPFSYQNSPFSYQNSPFYYQNSLFSYQNSPFYHQNSPFYYKNSPFYYVNTAISGTMSDRCLFWSSAWPWPVCGWRACLTRCSGSGSGRVAVARMQESDSAFYSKNE
jgi:hypothetical protein